MASGLFEIGVCEMPIVDNDLAVRSFRYETVCALSADDPLAQAPVLTPRLLSGRAFVVMGRATPQVLTGLRRWMNVKADKVVNVAPISVVQKKKKKASRSRETGTAVRPVLLPSMLSLLPPNPNSSLTLPESKGYSKSSQSRHSPASHAST